MTKSWTLRSCWRLIWLGLSRKRESPRPVMPGCIMCVMNMDACKELRPLCPKNGSAFAILALTIGVITTFYFVFYVSSFHLSWPLKHNLTISSLAVASLVALSLHVYMRHIPHFQLPSLKLGLMNLITLLSYPQSFIPHYTALPFSTATCLLHSLR